MLDTDPRSQLVVYGSNDLSRSTIGLSSAVTQLLSTLLSQPDLTETFLDESSVYTLDTHLVATGMIMSRMGLGSDDAFALLRRRAHSLQET